MEIRRIEPGDRAALERFLDEIPDADRTFLKEDVADPDVVAAWVLPGDARSIALDGGDVVGYVAVIPLHGWSRHVARSASSSTPTTAAAASGRRSRATPCSRRSSSGSPSWSSR